MFALKNLGLCFLSLSVCLIPLKSLFALLFSLSKCHLCHTPVRHTRTHTSTAVLRLCVVFSKSLFLFFLRMMHPKQSMSKIPEDHLPVKNMMNIPKCYRPKMIQKFVIRQPISDELNEFINCVEEKCFIFWCWKLKSTLKRFLNEFSP